MQYETKTHKIDTRSRLVKRYREMEWQKSIDILFAQEKLRSDWDCSNCSNCISEWDLLERIYNMITTNMMTTKLTTHPSVANFGSKIVLALWYTLCSVLGIFSAETVCTASHTNIRFWCKCKCISHAIHSCMMACIWGWLPASAICQMSSTIRTRAFSVAGPTVWNSLPDHLRIPAVDSKQFRWEMNMYLFAVHSKR